MDKSTILIIVILTGVKTESSHVEFLSKLIEDIRRDIPISTMLILNHQQSKDCVVQDWNNREIPTLRFNHLAKVEIRRHFNALGLCLVCIDRDSDISLLENVADSFEGMRQERIILWVHHKVTQELLNEILSLVDAKQFLKMLVIEVRYGKKETPIVQRLEAFPTPHFVRIENVTSAFFIYNINFMGRKAYVLPDSDTSVKHNAWTNATLAIPLSRIEDSEIIVFAKKYNLSLVVMGSSKHYRGDPNAIPDIYLRSELTTNGTDIKNLNPYDISSLIVVVPCSRKKSVGDVLRQLKVQRLVLYLLPVYVTFVVVETIIMMVTHRLHGHSNRLTSLNPLLNLRAFRAILGLPFPISRRSSLSLRQLFLAISVFGLVFSSLFSCKLSALLTMQSHHPQVENFDELRNSDLSVIVRLAIRSYIEKKFGNNFFEQEIPRAIFTNNVEFHQQLFSLNDTYAYIMPLEKWNLLDNYQKTIRRRALCDSKDLTIMSGIPRMFVLGNNSIYDWPLSRFLRRIRENGIVKHWINKSTYYLRQSLNITQYPSHRQRKVPIGLGDLMWLWFVLGFGYGMATFAFIMELFLSRQYR
ncbi:uncharacterized protein LOC119560305 [Drosophila subpulchrella]|uniref:uncharacterized protein LOC119560305 n=1 Tax=Drosophila subpulchrella TaxID=1486046 RepID=UPI0018A1B37E|nr:uncharacterized protein LOC119560305 [Drosophila subpulchrella]